MDYFAELDRLIEGPVYVIDYLPGPVPASRGRHYWKVEKWFSSQREYKRLYRKFLRLLLKLSCYCEFTASYGPKWEEKSLPQTAGAAGGKMHAAGKTTSISWSIRDGPW